MHCTNCGFEVPDGAALCPSCRSPQTAYAGQLTGEVSESAVHSSAQLAERPPVARAMALFDILVAFLVPLRITYARFAANPTSTGENANYIVAALGAAGATIVAFVMVPLAIALGVLAWGTMTQRTWAWYGNAALIGVMVLSAALVLGSQPFWAIFRAGLAGAFAWYWFQPLVRQWYGAQGRPW